MSAGPDVAGGGPAVSTDTAAPPPASRLLPSAEHNGETVDATATDDEDTASLRSSSEGLLPPSLPRAGGRPRASSSGARPAIVYQRGDRSVWSWICYCCYEDDAGAGRRRQRFRTKRHLMVALVAFAALLQSAGFQLVNDLCDAQLNVAGGGSGSNDLVLGNGGGGGGGGGGFQSSPSPVAFSAGSTPGPATAPGPAPAPSSAFGWTQARVELTFQATILGVFVSALPSGWLAWRHGFRVPLAVAVPGNLLLTALSPALVAYQPAALFLVRLLAGVCLATSFVCWFSLVARWVPADERTRALTSVFVGSYLGPALALPYRLVASGGRGPPSQDGQYAAGPGWWPVFGPLAGLAVVWLGLWLGLSVGSVSAATVRERRRIFETVPSARAAHQHRVVSGGAPWARLLTHRTVWALCLANLCFSSTLYIFTQTVPSFMRHYGLSPKPRLLFVSLPYPLLVLVAITGAWLSDWLIGRRHWSPTVVRQAIQVVALTAPTAILVLVAQIAFDPAEFASLTLIAVGLLGLNIPGLFTCVVDAVPSYTALCYGLMLTVACIPQIGCYYFYPYLHHQFKAWVAPMAAAGIINVLGTIIFVLAAVSVPIDSSWAPPVSRTLDF